MWHAVREADDAALSKHCVSYVIAKEFAKLRDVLNERSDGQTLMMFAAKEGLVRVAHTLMKHGADANVGLTREQTQQARGSDHDLSTPMALAALAGQDKIIALLLHYSIPYHDAFESCFSANVNQDRLGYVIHLLEQRRLKDKPVIVASEWKRLLLHWIAKPQSTQTVATVLFAAKIKPDDDAMLSAAERLNAQTVRLLRDYGATGDIVKVMVKTSSSSYYSDRGDQKLRKTAVQVALDEYTPDNKQEVYDTIKELCLAGARIRAEDLETIINKKDVELFRLALGRLQKPQASHLLLAAGHGNLSMVAALLPKVGWNDGDIESAATRAQTNGFTQTLTLLRAYQTVERLKPKSHSSWSWGTMDSLISSFASSSREPMQEKKLTQAEVAAQADLAEAEAYYALQLQLAKDSDKELTNTALPMPSVLATGEGQMVLYRG